MPDSKDHRIAGHRPRILFIAGYLRTGSTLLERLLAQVEGITATGEVRYIWTNGFRLNQSCGCGRPFRSCPFWTEVVKEAFGGFSRVDADRMARLQRSVDRLWHIPQMVAALRLPRYRRQLGEYLDHLERVLSSVRRISGARVVVDSSKAPSHGFLLHAIANFDVEVLHLVRDSRAVAHSWSRLKKLPGVGLDHPYMPRYGPVRAAFEWDVMNVAAHALRRPASRYLRLRYEDLAADPRAVISEALSAIGEPADRLDFLDGEVATLRPDHTVSGNPIRFATGPVRITPDVAWQREMRPGTKRVVTGLTWPLLRAYGYGVGAGP